MFWLCIFLIIGVDVEAREKQKAKDPLMLAATDTEMMWLKEDGSYK